MCNCAELPKCIANLPWNAREGEFEGATKFPEYFKEWDIDDDEISPEFDLSISNYRCNSCGQWWYVENQSESFFAPQYALKYDGQDKQPTKALISAHREFLSVLACGGFDVGECRMTMCSNHKLKGRELCQKHLWVP